MLSLVNGEPPLWIEMKSKRGTPSRAGRQVFADLTAMGCNVYVARSARAALMALHLSGVPLRPAWQPQWRERAEARKAARGIICLEPGQSTDSDGAAAAASDSFIAAADAFAGPAEE
jgi:hypothetical protein